jgi:hypothetical protein
MSSASWIYNTRRLNFPLPQKIQALIAQFNQKVTDDVTESGGEELTIRSEGGIGRSYIKFCDADLSRLDNSLTNTLLGTIQSAPTFEPDNNQCKVWCEFDNTGGTIQDYSGFSHTAHVHGVSRMWWGTRYGYGPLSLETIFDGRTNYAELDDHNDLSFDNVDFTLMFRILPFDLTMSSVHKQVVIAKKDPTAPNIWFAFELGEDGSATFNLSLSSTDKYSISLPAGTITDVAYADVTPTTQRYDIVITFAFLTRTLKLYCNGVSTSLSMITGSLPSGSIIPDYEGYDLQIGRYTALVGKPVTLPQIEDVDPIRLFSKLYFGTFQQLKYWKGKALTASEVTYHYTNKVTISNIPFGEVAIPNGAMILTT